MRRRLPLAWMGLALVAMVLNACTDDEQPDAGGDIQPIEVEDDEPEPEPDPESEPEPDPEPAAEAESEDPFAFEDPSEIDADYVDRVMAELFERDGALLRSVLAEDVSDQLDDEDQASLTALYSGPRLLAEADNYLEYASSPEIRGAFLPLEEIGSPAWDTARVVHADYACVVVIGLYDLADVSVEPFPAGEFTAVVLDRMGDDEELRFEALNPTGWRIHEQAQLVRGEQRQPVPEAEWGELDFQAALALPCDDFAADQ